MKKTFTLFALIFTGIVNAQSPSLDTNTYSVIRTDVVLNSGAAANFCFGDLGTCYASFVYEADEFSVLAPGGAVVPGKQLVTDLVEGSSIGYSEIYYKLFNVATGKTSSDTLSFTIKYNQLLSVNENATVLESVSNIYPNPSTNNANINVVLTDEAPVKIQVFNSLGSLVYNSTEQNLNGKNKLAVDCSNFHSGLYFITVTAGNSKVTKRLVVNK
ncbi:MAG: T9SS type A sorting domain-containing protein [Sphingobacteriaceae bacterium]|nr:T9SS type A sorting domain-containing protein [Sphingobacteriaceae bacterium]